MVLRASAAEDIRAYLVRNNITIVVNTEVAIVITYLVFIKPEPK
jgi:hypothetical protein